MAKALDLTGLRFGRLVVMRLTDGITGGGGKPRRRWTCLCDCGNTVVASTQDLRKGDVRSCGCLKHDETVKRMTSHGSSRTRLHNIWKAMRKRCRNIHNSDFAHYGGRGISVCSEWDSSFETFRDWALLHGYEDGLTIDRIDVNKGYSPDNCRFCSMKSQANNRTSNVVIEFNGESHTIKEWSEITGIPYSRLYMRLKKWGPVERSFQK